MEIFLPPPALFSSELCTIRDVVISCLSCLGTSKYMIAISLRYWGHPFPSGKSVNINENGVSLGLYSLIPCC